jgi:hypothetical protein
MPAQKKHKRRWIIGIGIVASLCLLFVIFIFKNGYKLPQRDKHKNWKLFPFGSNASLQIRPIDGIYIFMLQPLTGTDLFLISFQTDSAKFHDVNSGVRVFAIIDHRGSIKLKYENDVSVYYDSSRVIIAETNYGQRKKPFYCDVYDLMLQKVSRQAVSEIVLTGGSQLFAKDPDGNKSQLKKTQDSFFKSLHGVKAFDISYSPAAPAYRGYLIYTDGLGKLYSAPPQRDIDLYKLCPQCEGYYNAPPIFNAAVNGANIKLSDSSIIYENNFRYGIELGFSKHQGRIGIFYLSAYQTWLMYHTLTIGDKATSFKTEGSDKDRPYTSFYQLNTPQRAGDTLFFAANSRLWEARQH